MGLVVRSPVRGYHWVYRSTALRRGWLCAAGARASDTVQSARLAMPEPAQQPEQSPPAPPHPVAALSAAERRRMQVWGAVAALGAVLILLLLCATLGALIYLARTGEPRF